MFLALIPSCPTADLLFRQTADIRKDLHRSFSSWRENKHTNYSIDVGSGTYTQEQLRTAKDFGTRGIDLELESHLGFHYLGGITKPVAIGISVKCTPELADFFGEMKQDSKFLFISLGEISREEAHDWITGGEGIQIKNEGIKIRLDAVHCEPFGLNDGNVPILKRKNYLK